ncbi:MAG: L-glyceraldehyde 3-phosphate reductase [Bacteroidetes bacterium]|nr:L-glyceraldehyde 3-phosphate reductase [Bacteroidota bacterium]
MMYAANNDRYGQMEYKRCGNSGLKLPRVSLGLWHNFGDVDVFSNAREMIFGAFDMGITHFDLANNYGPSPGSAEETFGKVMRDDLSKYRDELIISSKAGYDMWPGPYGEWGSRKYMTASLDQSLKRMGIEYVDIFYSHRFDPETPLEETMGALAHAVTQGKALYVGISSYQPEDTRRAAAILKDMNTPCLIHQPSYSILNRWIENGLTDVLDEEQIGCIVFSPLSQGLLTNKYLREIPEDSRAARGVFLKKASITPELVSKLKKLNNLAESRSQSLAQMAISWVLHNKTVTSAVIGASRLSQIVDCVQAAENTDFSEDELSRIDTIIA